MKANLNAAGRLSFLNYQAKFARESLLDLKRDGAPADQLAAAEAEAQRTTTAYAREFASQFADR